MCEFCVVTQTNFAVSLVVNSIRLYSPYSTSDFIFTRIYIAGPNALRFAQRKGQAGESYIQKTKKDERKEGKEEKTSKFN